MNLEWETVKVKVKDLVKFEINPRKISEEKKESLAKSLGKFNLVEIPAVNTDMTVIGGNQRVVALLLAGRGEEEIDVRMPNRELTDLEVKEYSLISNTHAGEFDFEVLDFHFGDVDLEDIGFDIEGLDEWKEGQVEELEPGNDAGVDLSEDVSEKHEVVCECKNETEQEGLFLRLSNEGVQCRILTL